MIWNSQGYIYSKRNLQGLINNKVEFLEVVNKVVLVLGLKISKGCDNKILRGL